MFHKIALIGALAISVALPSDALAWGHGGGFGHGGGHSGWGGHGGGFGYHGGWRGGFGRPAYWGGPHYRGYGWGYRRNFYRPVGAYWGGYNGCYRLRPVWTGWGWTQRWVNVCAFPGGGYNYGW